MESKPICRNSTRNVLSLPCAKAATARNTLHLCATRLILSGAKKQARRPDSLRVTLPPKLPILKVPNLTSIAVVTRTVTEEIHERDGSEANREVDPAFRMAKGNVIPILHSLIPKYVDFKIPWDGRKEDFIWKLTLGGSPAFSYIMTLSLHVTTWLTFCTTRCLWSAFLFPLYTSKKSAWAFRCLLVSFMECTPKVCPKSLFFGKILLVFFFSRGPGSDVEQKDPMEYRIQGLLLAVDLYKV